MALRAAEVDEDALVARAFSRPCRHSCRHAFGRVFKRVPMALRAAESVGHLVYCWQAGLGQFDPALIDVRGQKIAAVRREYLLPANVEPLEEWMRPIQDLPTMVPAL